METIESLKKRRSIRKYSEKDIPENIIKEIIDCARLSPSARNEQNWEFIIVKDKNIKLQIADIASNGNFLKEAPVLIIVLSREGKYFLEDGCAATENILIASTSFKLGSCWIAGHKKDYCDAVKKMLNVPQGYNIVSLISIGYPAEFPEEHGKRKLEDIIHWEKF